MADGVGLLAQGHPPLARMFLAFWLGVAVLLGRAAMLPSEQVALEMRGLSEMVHFGVPTEVWQSFIKHNQMNPSVHIMQFAGASSSQMQAKEGMKDRDKNDEAKDSKDEENEDGGDRPEGEKKDQT